MKESNDVEGHFKNIKNPKWVRFRF